MGWGNGEAVEHDTHSGHSLEYANGTSATWSGTSGPGAALRHRAMPIDRCGWASFVMLRSRSALCTVIACLIMRHNGGWKPPS